MAKVSVVVPVYNVQAYLAECVSSILNQAYRDIELICVDDGSDDGSLDTLQRLSKEDSRITIVARNHTNAGACRNAGLSVASGEYLLFLDSDDVFSPGMISSMVALSETYDADIVSCGVERFEQGMMVPKLHRKLVGREKVVKFPGKTGEAFRGWSGRAWDKLFRRRLIDRYGLVFQEIRSTNDARFTYSALSLCNKVVKTTSVFVAHRDHATSLEHTRSKGVGCMPEMMDSYVKEMLRIGVFPTNQALYKAFRVWCLGTLLWYMDTMDTGEAFRAVYEQFPAIAKKFDLSSVQESDYIGGWSRNPEKLKRILNGGPIDYLLAECRIQKEEYLGSKDYRLGRAMLKIPRWIKGWL